MREGKVYVNAQAERALKHFFSPGNLTALRELALRRTAQRVDRDMTDYMQTHAIGGPWAAGERILVCVDERPASAELVRRARRLADNARAEWTAVYVEGAAASVVRRAGEGSHRRNAAAGATSGRGDRDHSRPRHRSRLARLRQAQQRHADIDRQVGAAALVRAAARLGRARADARQRRYQRHRRARAKRCRRAETGRDNCRARPERLAWRSYVWSALALAATVGVACAATTLMHLALGSVGMFFLVPVLLSAVSFGLRPALFTSFASVMAYNFFFLPPLYTFAISNPNNWLSFAVLLLVAVTAANLAARVRAQADLAASRAQVAGELYQFTGKLAASAQIDDILWAAAFQIASMLKMSVVILLPDTKTARLDIRAGYPPEDELDAQDLAAATVEPGERRTAAGRDASKTLPGAKRLFLPMRTGQGLVGVTGLLTRPKTARGRSSRTTGGCSTRCSTRPRSPSSASLLAERVDEAQVRAEADKLRVAMLSSLSHDLRTPLATILGASTSLISGNTLYNAEQTADLLATIRDEAERMDRFRRQPARHMSRLRGRRAGHEGRGRCRCARWWKPRSSGWGAGSLRSIARHRSRRRVCRWSAADPLLLEQSLVNLLDNAAKYAPAGTRIRVTASMATEHELITVEDEGPGIAPDALPHIFDKFYRAKDADRRAAGTGLGLAVARGFVESFGGTLEAANRGDGRGAVLTLSLPRAPEEDHGA